MNYGDEKRKINYDGIKFGTAVIDEDDWSNKVWEPLIYINNCRVKLNYMLNRCFFQIFDKNYIRLTNTSLTKRGNDKYCAYKYSKMTYLMNYYECKYSGKNYFSKSSLISNVIGSIFKFSRCQYE